MSELIVAKAGGTSNADAESVMKSLEWAERSNIFVPSAPGKLDDGGKVTDALLVCHDVYEQTGDIPKVSLDYITERYATIVRGLSSGMTGRWIDTIQPRVRQAVLHGEHAASMIGERLQAEIYEAQGFTLLDPGRGPANLSNNHGVWREWLESVFEPDQHYVLLGNTTRVNGHLETFDRGGSDTTSGYAAYGIGADLNLNLTDGPAKSADPRLFKDEEYRLKIIDHMLLEEGREFGHNGTGLVHPAAMVPLMIGGIPTEIRSTFDSEAPVTRLDNNQTLAKKRAGRVIGLSIMKDVCVVRVHEPGMAEGVGRLADFETALADQGIALIDSVGAGVDTQKYLVPTEHAEQATTTLYDTASAGSEVIPSNPLAFISLIGYGIGTQHSDEIFGLARRYAYDNDVSQGVHRMRIATEDNLAEAAFRSLHRVAIEQNNS